MAENSQNPEKISIVGKGLIFFVRLYQLTLSPYIGKQCKFSPSCSNYFIEAVKQHGAFKGARLGIWRIIRCNPFSKGGFDPVP